MHRADISKLGGAPVPGPRHTDILFQALTAFIKCGKPVLAWREPLGGGTFVPFSRLFQILGYAGSLCVARSYFDLRCG
jgi:hypothetical protein